MQLKQMGADVDAKTLANQLARGVQASTISSAKSQASMLGNDAFQSNMQRKFQDSLGLAPSSALHDSKGKQGFLDFLYDLAGSRYYSGKGANPLK